MSAASLSFDQYQRYQLVAQLVDRCFSGPSPLSILDVGGADGLLDRLLPSHGITVLDPSDVRRPLRLVRGSGTAIPFGAGSFDLVNRPI